MAVTQKRMDQLIVQAKRRHKERMVRLMEAFLGKRAEFEEEINGVRDSQRQIKTDNRPN